MPDVETWDEFSERLRDLETTEHAPEIVSPFLALPGLRGFWPMSAFESGGNAFDQSGNSRTLTYNGNPAYSYDGIVPYIYFDGTGDYLDRADEAGLDILGTEAYVNASVRGLTFGGWFYPTQTGVFEIVMGKWGAAPNRSYALWFIGTNNFVTIISDDGTNSTQDATAVAALNSWYFVVGRFQPAVSVDTFLNGTWTTTPTARAAVFNGNSAFAIGANAGGGSPWQGRASLCFLCAAMLSDSIIGSLFRQTRMAFGV